MNLSKLINEKDRPSRIVKAIRHLNLGRIVVPTEYLGYHIEGETVEMDGEAWTCPVTDHFWRIFSEGGIVTMYGESKVAYLADTWMRPIKPVEDPRSTEIEGIVEA